MLDSGLVGTMRSEFWLQGTSSRRFQLRSNITGPFADDYLRREQIPLNALTWSSCLSNRAVNVRTSVSITGANSHNRKQGLMTVDSLDGELRQIYGLHWRRCP